MSTKTKKTSKKRVVKKQSPSPMQIALDTTLTALWDWWKTEEGSEMSLSTLIDVSDVLKKMKAKLEA